MIYGIARRNRKTNKMKFIFADSHGTQKFNVSLADTREQLLALQKNYSEKFEYLIVEFPEG